MQEARVVATRLNAARLALAGTVQEIIRGQPGQHANSPRGNHTRSPVVATKVERRHTPVSHKFFSDFS